MGSNRNYQRFNVALAVATAYILVMMTSCAEPQRARIETATAVASSAVNSSAPSLDNDIAANAGGDTLDFECANPIATGSTAMDLGGGEDKPGVSDLMFINTDQTGTGKTQWVDGASANGFHFQKMGLIMKAGAAFTLSVPTGMHKKMKIGFSNSGSMPANELVTSGCNSDQANANWLVYPGGFWLKEPQCVPLVITTDQESQTIYIPIGKTCQ